MYLNGFENIQGPLGSLMRSTHVNFVESRQCTGNKAHAVCIILSRQIDCKVLCLSFFHLGLTLPSLHPPLLGNGSAPSLKLNFSAFEWTGIAPS